MAAVLDRSARAFLGCHRIARFATADALGAPHLVPLCYARVGECLYFVVDAKPKHPGGLALKRMRNIAANPAVAVIVDDYAEDWTTLAFLSIRGRAEVVTNEREQARALAALRARYPQYRAMVLEGAAHPVIRITPTHAHFWRARSPTGDERPVRRAASPDRPTSPRPRAQRRRH